MGLKSRGEGDLLSPVTGIEGGTCRSFRSWVVLVVEDDKGESEDFLTLWPITEELGDASSGLAIRRPPRDCERLKSPFMIEVAWPCFY